MHCSGFARAGPDRPGSNPLTSCSQLNDVPTRIDKDIYISYFTITVFELEQIQHENWREQKVIYV